MDVPPSFHSDCTVFRHMHSGSRGIDDAHMPLELISPITIVVAAVVIIMLEHLRPYDAGQHFLREDFWSDFALYAVVQSYILGLVIFGSLHAIGQIFDVTVPGPLSHLTIAQQVGASLLVHDIYIYWFHRLQHYSPLLWRIHEAHHSNTDVDWLSGSRSHPLEILINQSIEFAPLVLLGASPEAILIKGMIDAVWGMYIHSNIDIRTGWLQYLINGPEMHRWHHAVEKSAHNRNFSTKFAVWDWIFGTAYRPGGRPSGYGLGDEPYPRGYWRQVAWVFAARRREEPTDTSEQSIIIE